ncbi:hypothetical protein CVV65_06070 [Kyrpidia spormannii]|uniref:Uncharacterized protein n=2 Tax=Kyrpidia TaxID=1129704 RepID=A0A2K8N653_9BACL|nr:hypothetical protein CVV65_06070 [Kyrpidia spormannii]
MLPSIWPFSYPRWIVMESTKEGLMALAVQTGLRVIQKQRDWGKRQLREAWRQDTEKEGAGGPAAIGGAA